MNKFDKYVVWYPFKVVPKTFGKPPKELKSIIPKTEFDLSYRYQFLLTQDFIKKKNLRKALGSINNWIEKVLFKGQEKNYKVLKLELIRFLKEIESNHYISSAIMISLILYLALHLCVGLSDSTCHRHLGQTYTFQLTA